MISTDAYIRAYLRENSDGASIAEICNEIGAKKSAVRHTLQLMPDAYVDRWQIQPGTIRNIEQVWCVVVPPPNCPMPSSSKKSTERSA